MKENSEHYEAQLLLEREFFILYSYRVCCLNYQHFVCLREHDVKSRTEPAQKPAF